MLNLNAGSSRDELIRLLNHQLLHADRAREQMAAAGAVTESTQGAVKALLVSTAGLLRGHLADDRNERLLVIEMVDIASRELDEADSARGTIKALMTIMHYIQMVIGTLCAA